MEDNKDEIKKDEPGKQEGTAPAPEVQPAQISNTQLVQLMAKMDKLTALLDKDIKLDQQMVEKDPEDYKE